MHQMLLAVAWPRDGTKPSHQEVHAVLLSFGGWKRDRTVSRAR